MRTAGSATTSAAASEAARATVRIVPSTGVADRGVRRLGRGGEALREGTAAPLAGVGAPDAPEQPAHQLPT